MYRRLLILIPLLLLAIEGGVQAWRYAGRTPSTAPLFDWRQEPILATAPPPFGTALEIYRADRGAEQTKEFPRRAVNDVFLFRVGQHRVGAIH